MDAKEYRERSRAVWDEAAGSWEEHKARVAEAGRPIATWMVERLAPQPGHTLLELAAGPGETGFAAAAALGAEGRLICTDFAPGMVEAARREGAALGLRNVDYRAMDAEQLDLPDDSVDGVLCRWGFMLMADPLAAFRETRRVLKDGGRLVFTTFTTPPHNPWAGVPARVLIERGHMPPPQPGAPGIFALAEPERVTRLLADAGFAAPQCDEIAMRFRFTDFEDYWEFLTHLAGALAPLLKSLQGDEATAVREAIAAGVEGFRVPDGLDIPGV